MLSWQNLGMKEIMAVELMSFLPKTYAGSSKFQVVQVKTKSLLGKHYLSRVYYESVLLSLLVRRLSLCDLDQAKHTFLLVLSLMVKFQKNYPLAWMALSLKPRQMTSLGMWAMQRGQIVPVMCSSQKILELRVSSCRQTISILTISLGPTFPTCKLRISLLLGSIVPRAACLPFFTAYLYYAYASFFSFTMPQILLLAKEATRRQTQALGLMGKQYQISRNFSVGFQQVCVRVILATALTIQISYSEDFRGIIPSSLIAGTSSDHLRMQQPYLRFLRQPQSCFFSISISNIIDMFFHRLQSFKLHSIYSLIVIAYQ